MMATRAMRSPSLSSDVASTRSAAAPALPEANPPPSYVACAEASQLVSSEVDDGVSVNEEAITLLNSFLDSILYNVLAAAKSVQLSRLRNAVPVVLKPRLGKAALAAADEELKEYLNDGDDDILTGSEPRSEHGNGFDLDLAWKLARLRCMVYTRLGDMEEEDEEEYVELEQLHPAGSIYTNAAHRASSVKAASAIFLTSILEYLGEQALLYAVQNTQRRAQAPKSPVAMQLDENGPMSPPIHRSMVLDESDMFYIGRESPLSRLWRSWRRQARLPPEATSRQMSPIQDDQACKAEATPQVDKQAVQEEILPHQVPMPISDNDVNEIEVPGLAREIVDDQDAQPAAQVPEEIKKRPASMVITRSNTADHLSSESPRLATSDPNIDFGPNFGRKRSLSHPAPDKSTFSTTADGGVVNMTRGEEKQDAEDGSLQHSTSQKTTDFAPEGGDQQSEDKQRSEERPTVPVIMETAVPAVAGALDLQALSSMTKPKDNGLGEAQAKPFRTAADEMIGTTPQVAPPNDAVTGSSITKIDDFDNLHIPVENRELSGERKTVSRLESSDPEDLALSSGDEDAMARDATMPADDVQPSGKEDSSFTSAPVPHTNAVQTKAANNTSLSDTGQMSKPNNQQGTIIPTSEETYEKPISVVNYEEPDRPLYVHRDRSVTTGSDFDHHTTTRPVTSSASSVETAINRNVVSPAHAKPDKSVIIRESEASRPNTARTAVQSSMPSTVSSDFSGSGQARTHSGRSQYSQDSSSSRKLPGLVRDNESRPQTGNVKGPVQNGIYGSSTSGPKMDKEAQSDTLRLVKKPLRIETRAGPEKHLNEAEAKERSLEVLIRGDETLHYTLTPVSARAENFSFRGHSPETSRNISSRDGSSAAQHSARSISTDTTNGLRSNPVHEMALPPASRTRTTTYDSQSNGTTPIISRQVRPGTKRVEPRDARLDNTSTMMDLADYARSTGPENDQQLAKILSLRPGTAATVKTMHSVTNSVRSGPRSPMQATRTTTPQSPSLKSVGARVRFQAREPTIARRSGTNDLIEFLREGPPLSAGAMNGHVLSDGRSSNASTQDSSVAPRSIQESTKSSTALLASSRAPPNKVNSVNPNTAAAARNAAVQQNDAMPARKQRRMRDPYAIDDSEDDLEEEQTPAQLKRAQDESLIDFLRNTAPPPGSSPPPISAGSFTAASNTAPAAAVNRQPSTQTMRDRIMRSTSKSSLTQKAGFQNVQPAVKNEVPPQYYRSATHARQTSPHLVQTGKKTDMYKPTTATHAAHVDRNRAQMKARPPTSSSRIDTAQLAEYLKTSGPAPDNSGRLTRQSSVVKEEAGFFRFFSWRRAVK